ncbi:uncharacterized protein LOC122938865 isoform X2 [Bufo gargarizans]|uniref:uncharacterized protein LOC122938865 isoform X2 n=1 Tax=Bufo gargarizans TaxID=30331 RepID=UPI001CF51126|nr:uncharacterized protein LOC122938865 isoform X2 [Bufo gargarizans]
MLLYMPPFLALLLCGAPLTNGDNPNSEAISMPPIKSTLSSNISAAPAPANSGLSSVPTVYQNGLMDASQFPTKMSDPPTSRRMMEITGVQSIQEPSTPVLTSEEPLSSVSTMEPIAH